MRSNSLRLLAVATVFICSAVSSLQAQVFQNLDFEQASPVYDNDPQAGYGANPPASTVSALPDWTANYGDTPVSIIWGEADALDETAVQLVGASFNRDNETYGLGSGALQGQYSVDLYAVGGNVQTVSISQLGQIPTDDKSIQFLVSAPSDEVDSTPYVTFNGNAIALTPGSTSGGTTIMIGDISAYAGMTGTLAFSAKPQSFGSSPYYYEDDYVLDSISFSTASAPEPSTWALLLCGLGVIGVTARRRASL